MQIILVDDLRFLNKDDIIMCQLNDAVKGRTRQDEQIDLGEGIFQAKQD